MNVTWKEEVDCTEGSDKKRGNSVLGTTVFLDKACRYYCDKDYEKKNIIFTRYALRVVRLPTT